MLGFLGGAAKGAQGELEDQDKRAFALKLQNAQIEGQIRAAKELSDYERPGEIATSDMSGGAQPGRANKADQQWWMQKNRDASLKEMSANKAGGMGRDSISGAEANKSLRANYFKPGDTVTRLAYSAAQARVRAESPTANQDAAYTELQAGLENMRQLKKLRQEADKSGWTGPFAGRAGSAVGAITGGKYAKLNKKLKAAMGLYAPAVAKASGHVGNLNVQEVAAALEGMGDTSIDGELAVEQLDGIIGNFERKLEQLRKDKPAIDRREALGASGQNLLDLAGKPNQAASPTEPNPYDEYSDADLANAVFGQQGSHEKVLEKKTKQEEKKKGN